MVPVITVRTRVSPTEYQRRANGKGLAIRPVDFAVLFVEGIWGLMGCECLRRKYF